jgi:phenylacetate-CoA ligase
VSPSIAFDSMINPVARFRERRLVPLLDAAAAVYEESDTDVAQRQLEKFAATWRRISSQVPYFEELVRRNAAPREIRDWDDLRALPVMTRRDLQHELEQRMDPSLPVARWSASGGSTGEPVRVPRAAPELVTTALPLWLGRRFYGIRPGDRMFHLWGHSHLFGQGPMRHWRRFERGLKNRLLGYRRFSAYNLTPERLAAATEAILRMSPDYIVGYSRSLALLARHNEHRRAAFRDCRMKAVIATTEAFLDEEDADAVAAVFGCPVAMEYGANEVGVMAYTHPADGRYRVFWDDYLLETVPGEGGQTELLVTCLFPRAVPLVRYAIGDSVRGCSTSGGGITGFASVLGRDHDLLEMEPGVRLHSEALTHCLVAQPGVLGAQVVQEQDASVTFNLLCDNPLGDRQQEVLRRDLGTLHPMLANSTIRFVDHLEQTPAGKTKWIIRR